MTELRTWLAQVDAAEVRTSGGKSTFFGHAAVFDKPSEDMGQGWREYVRPGAFSRAIKEGQDVRLLINHDPNLVLARTKSGTMEMREDDTGLAVTASLPNTTYARDLAELLQRGDVDQMSFGFKAVGQQWDEAKRTRSLTDLDVFDASVVTFPAYPDSDAGLRSLLGHLGYDLRDVAGFSDLPLAPADAVWDGEGTVKRLAAWASSDGTGEPRSIDFNKFKRAFLHVDKEHDQELGGYKLPIADLLDGQLRVFPRGLAAAAAQLHADGAGLPARAADEARAHAERYYAKLGDDSVAPPWTRSLALRAISGLTASDYPALFEELRAGKVLSTSNRANVKQAIAALQALLAAAGDEEASRRRRRRRLELLGKEVLPGSPKGPEAVAYRWEDKDGNDDHGRGGGGDSTKDPAQARTEVVGHNGIKAGDVVKVPNVNPLTHLHDGTHTFATVTKAGPAPTGGHGEHKLDNGKSLLGHQGSAYSVVMKHSDGSFVASGFKQR